MNTHKPIPSQLRPCLMPITLCVSKSLSLFAAASFGSISVWSLGTRLCLLGFSKLEVYRVDLHRKVVVARTPYLHTNVVTSSDLVF